MADTVEELLTDLIQGQSHALTRDSVWLYVKPVGIELPEHGWKLHVSSRSTTFPDLVATLVPALLNEGCAFKLANSRRTLSELNDGKTSATVGKAFTIYPAPERVRALGHELVNRLRGWQGPRVLSDRRIDETAPVYYRYGPFIGVWSADRKGRPLISMLGPDGAEFEGEATIGYRQPPWAIDPFGGADVDDDLLLGDRYRVVEGIYESVRGNVYRAIDEQTSEPVVVKQARALVSEDADHADTRMRIRNERRILEAAMGIAGVPRFIDHFRHQDDEFLVTNDLGSTNLTDDLRENGPVRLDPVRLDPGSDRSLQTLAGELARIVSDLHSHGIVMRDLAPKNIIMHSDGPRLVDFGIAAYQGVHLIGGTPGYAPARQLRNEPPSETDDLYALGMTLIEAMSGLPPVVLEGGQRSRERALETVRSLHGASPTGLVAAIVDLLSDDTEVVRHAFRRLSGQSALSPSVSGQSVDQRVETPLPKPPTVTESLIEELTAQVLDDLLSSVDSFLEDSSHTFRRQDLTVYSGIAGAGLELVHHRAHPGVRDRLSRLGRVLRASVDQAELEPGLFAGRTGIEVFLRMAELPGPEQRSAATLATTNAATTNAASTTAATASATWKPTGHDLIEGAAGIGIGHLWLHERDGDPADLEVARLCANHLAGFVAADTDGHTYGHTKSDVTLAHGLAGVLEFELRMVACPTICSEAEGLADRLVAPAEAMLDRAMRWSGDPLTTVSWCNGLAGLARTLVHAGRKLDRPDLDLLAKRAARACASWIPRLHILGQCCGASGIGDLLLDVAQPDEAIGVVRHLLMRSGGPPGRPMFVKSEDHDTVVSWAAGLTGILGFLRRVRDGGGPRILPGV